MWSFRSNRLLEPVDITVANLMAALGRYRGRQELFEHQAPQVLETLHQIAIVESTEASNREEHPLQPPLPRIEEVPGSVVVTLYAADLSKLAEEERATRWAGMRLNERQVRALEYLTRSPSLSRQEYSELCQTSARTAARDLKDLLERGFIERHGGGRWARYSLVES